MVIKYRPARRRRSVLWVLLPLLLWILLMVAGYFYLYRDVEPVQLGEEGVTYYYYEKLHDDGLKKKYNKILQGIYNHDSTILVSMENEYQLKLMMNMVLYDHPELFWVDNGWDTFMIQKAPITLSPVYIFTAEEQEELKAKLDEEVAKALEVIPKEGSDYDKIKAIYEYVIDQVTYDLDSPDNQSIYSSMVNKVSVCAGYAKAVQYLAQKSGLEAVYVTGNTLDEEPHAWNAVKCDGKYYYVDATYGDNEREEVLYPKELRCDYSFLCMTGDELALDRTIDEYQEPPVCDSDDLNYYRKNDLIFGTVKKAKANMKKTFQNGGKVWKVAFSKRKAYENMLIELGSTEMATELSGWVSEEEQKSISMYVQFDDKRKTVAVWYKERDKKNSEKQTNKKKKKQSNTEKEDTTKKKETVKAETEKAETEKAETKKSSTKKNKKKKAKQDKE